MELSEVWRSHPARGLVYVFTDNFTGDFTGVDQLQEHVFCTLSIISQAAKQQYYHANSRSLTSSYTVPQDNQGYNQGAV
jgi:hypothetical protein